MLESAITEVPDEEIEALFRSTAQAQPESDAEAKTRQLVIINWSGELDKIWPTLIMSTAAAASGYKAKVFITFWGLLPFVQDQRRIVGESWMQKMLTLMQRPGISHLKLSKMNFLGMGPWMIGKLSSHRRSMITLAVRERNLPAQQFFQLRRRHGRGQRSRAPEIGHECRDRRDGSVQSRQLDHRPRLQSPQHQSAGRPYRRPAADKLWRRKHFL